MNAVVEIASVGVMRGAKTVLHDISIRLEQGRTVALLGPNGAGKSSLVLALAGVLPIMTGRISLDGKQLDGSPPELIRRAGIAAVLEGHLVLTQLTVRENLDVAAALLDRREARGALDRCYQVFPELRDLDKRTAGSMSGGQQQMLAIAQALAAKPRFLLVDEMSLGLAPIVVQRLMGAIQHIAGEGVGVLLIEQFLRVALRLADYVYVIGRGRIRFEGTPDALRANPGILQEAYLAGAMPAGPLVQGAQA